MKITHRGHTLNQQQLDAIVPTLNDYMHSKIVGKKQFKSAIDQALEKAGCPLPSPAEERAPAGTQ